MKMGGSGNEDGGAGMKGRDTRYHVYFFMRFSKIMNFSKYLRSDFNSRKV